MSFVAMPQSTRNLGMVGEYADIRVLVKRAVKVVSYFFSPRAYKVCTFSIQESISLSGYIVGLYTLCAKTRDINLIVRTLKVAMPQMFRENTKQSAKLPTLQ